MTNCKVSLIVPVFNVEKYLRRCVDSILTQTYQNIEVILVDDGSPDACPAICDEYAAKDRRVHVIHQRNAGLSGARNTGFAAVSGQYVGFVDSDDWIAKDTIGYCLDLLDKYKADSIQFDIALVSKDTPVASPEEKVDVYSGKEILQYYMDSSTRKSGGYSVCRCLFPVDVACKHRFRTGKINEDIDYKYKLLSKCQKLVISNQLKYYYWQADESTSTGGLKLKDFDLYEAADALAELTSEESYGTIAFLGKVKQARTAMSLLCKIAYYGIADSSIDKKEIVEKLTKEHRRNLKLLLKAPIPWSRKILSVLFAINYNITERAIHFTKTI